MRVTSFALVGILGCGGNNNAIDAAIDGTVRDDVLGDGQSGPHTYLYQPGMRGVSGFRVDPTTGDLTQIDMVPGGTTIDPAPTGGNSIAAVAHPSGKFLYSSNFTDSTVSAFTIDAASGLLTKIAPDAPSGGSNPAYIAMDPMGRVLYVSNVTDSKLATFAIDGTTGALTAMGSIDVTQTPRGLAVDAGAHVLAVAGNTAPGKVTMCKLDATTGLPTAVDANGAIAGRQDFDADQGPISVVFNQSATRLYVAASTAGKLDFYTVDPSTGMITASPSVSTTNQPISFAMTANGKFLFLTANGKIDDFSISVDGTPTPISATDLAQPSPRSIGFDPLTKFMYVGDDNSMIYRYTIDATSGAITPKGTTAFDDTNGYTAIVVTR